jgi:hypothetical protein
VTLEVGSQVNGKQLNINNGGSVSVKGGVNAGINLSGRRREPLGAPLERSAYCVYEPVFNRATRMTDAGWFATNHLYDDRGNLLRETYPDTLSATNTYGARGLKLASANERNRVTSYS